MGIWFLAWHLWVPVEKCVPGPLSSCLLWISCTESSYVMVFSQVKVSFHTTLELLTYQHLPDTQLLPGMQMLQSENGEKKLQFNQNLVIEHSNSTCQVWAEEGLWAMRKGCFSSASLPQNAHALGSEMQPPLECVVSCSSSGGIVSCRKIVGLGLKVLFQPQ